MKYGLFHNKFFYKVHIHFKLNYQHLIILRFLFVEALKKRKFSFVKNES